MIGVLGINHKTAQQDVRELFSFTREEIIPFSELARQATDISEIVVLSTCNRTEIYFYHENNCIKKVSKLLTGILHDYKNVSENHAASFYIYKEPEAVKHLFRVVSGMDSLVIGEDQIVKQVKDAYIYSTEAVLTEAVLMRLFQKCFETGKRVRTETSIQKGPASLSKIAVDLCSRIYTDLPDRKALFVGSGETGRLALHYMSKKGIVETGVSNRTLENAQALAGDYNSKVIDFEKLIDYLPEYDIVLVATCSPGHIIKKRDIQQVQAKRDNKLQVYIDLSVPRNIETSISVIKNIKLYGVDDMQEMVNSKSVKLKSGIEHATRIINEMSEEYMQWFECLSLRPLIKTITRNMKKIRDDEIKAYKDIEDKQKLEIIDEYTSRITNKYIGIIIKNLRNASRDKASSGSMKIVDRLFKLE